MIITDDINVETHDGLTLHAKTYQANGLESSVPTILCLHGLTRNERDFTGLARWLAENTFGGTQYQIICLSFRGRGFSEWDDEYLNYHPITYVKDVTALLDQQGIENAVFIGTSLGGLVTMLTASEHPSRVRAGILNDIGPELAPEGIARIGGYVGGQSDIKTWEDAAAYIKSINGVAFPDADDAFWAKFARNTFREIDGKLTLDYDPKIADALAEAGPAPEMWPHFEAIICPTLAIRGEISDLYTEEIEAKMLQRKPALKTAVVPRVGHAPTLEEDAAKAAIEHMLNSLP